MEKGFGNGKKHPRMRSSSPININRSIAAMVVSGRRVETHTCVYDADSGKVACFDGRESCCTDSVVHPFHLSN